MVGRSLSGPISVQRQVVTAEAREGSVCCSRRPPYPYSGDCRRVKDPCVTVSLHVSAGAPWSPLELFSVLLERRGAGGPKARASSCHSGRTEWRPRKRRPDGAHPQPTTSGLYHPIRPHRSFCLCDLSSSLSLESVTQRSALTAFLSPGLT